MMNAEQIGVMSPQDFWLTVVPFRLNQIQDVSPVDATARVSDARQTIDDELAAMHLAMCSFRTRRNALAPISSLPSEVLARVFQLYAVMAPPFSAYPASVNALSRLGWIRVTFVCRYWRDTALHNPALWSDIRSFANPNWLELILARAKAAPLSIRKQLHAPDDGLINNHLSHIQHLSVSGAQQVIGPIVKSWTSSADILESLELEVTSLYSSGSLVFPEDVFSLHTPLLRRLQLKYFKMSWSAPILSGLMHLQVDLGLGGSGSPLHTPASIAVSPYEQLFGALERMPALEELVLRSCIPVRPQGSNNISVTELPRLQSLSLAGTWAECEGVTKRLKIPPPCRLRLYYRSIPSQLSTVLSESTPFFMSHANAASQPPLLTLSISVRNGEVELSAWRVCRATDKMPVFCPDGNPDLSVKFPSHGLPLSDITQTLCDVLQLDSLRALSLDSGSFVRWSPQEWINTFRGCGNLQHVKVVGMNAIYFCRALVTPRVRGRVEKDKKKGKQRMRPEDFFAKELKTITMEQVDFDTSLGNGGVVFHDALVKWLSIRQKIIELPMLLIQDCSITQDWVYQLEDIVRVEWDYDEGDYVDEVDLDEEYCSDDVYQYPYFNGLNATRLFG